MTVIEMFNNRIVLALAAQNIKSQVNALDAINIAIDHITKMLMLHSSDLVRGKLMKQIKPGTSCITLPDDFNGIESSPVYSSVSRTFELFPLIESDLEHLLRHSSGCPLKYSIEGTKMTLYPTSDSHGSLTFSYHKLFDVLEMSDDIPFNGLLDNIIAEVAIRVCASGVSVLVEQSLIVEIGTMIDQILIPRSRPLPSRNRPIQHF